MASAPSTLPVGGANRLRQPQDNVGIAFARAAQGGPAYPIPTDEMIHGVAVTEAIVRSAASEKVEKV